MRVVRFLRACLPCSLAWLLLASSSAHEDLDGRRCSRSPISAFVVQQNCLGSTWAGVLLENMTCSQRFRLEGNADGAFHGSIASVLEFVRPRTPSRRQPWGEPARTAGALIYPSMAEELARYFGSAHPSRRTEAKYVVVMLVREPIFQAVCDLKKDNFVTALKREFGSEHDTRARQKCADANHPTREGCPLAMDFKWRQDPKSLLCRAKEHEARLLETARIASRLARAVGGRAPIIMRYADLVCSRGALPWELRAALGEVLEAPSGNVAAGRRLSEAHLKRSCPRSHPDCDSGRSWGSADQVGVQQTKLTPANPARAMKNLREIAAYFDANGRDADARRLLTPSEACANVTTIGRTIWDALNTSAGCEIDANSRAHGGAPRCDTSSKGPVPGRQQAWLGHGRKPRRLN